MFLYVHADVLLRIHVNKILPQPSSLTLPIFLGCCVRMLRILGPADPPRSPPPRRTARQVGPCPSNYIPFYTISSVNLNKFFVTGCQVLISPFLVKIYVCWGKKCIFDNIGILNFFLLLCLFLIPLSTIL